MSSSSCGNIYLDLLSAGIPVITARSAGHFIEACMVCLDSQNHLTGVRMNVETDEGEVCFHIHWSEPVTDEHHRAHGGNDKRTTELGATAIGLPIIKEVTDFAAIQEASIGTTIDYFLRRKEVDDTYIFDGIEAYCEIRGIRRENSGNTINQAVHRKIKRLNTPEELPCYIVIVEFSRPFTKVKCL
jgi:hypothetical protein